METLNQREEAAMLSASKEATDLIVQGKHPTDAVEKIARAEKFGPGRIRTLAWACNTARQLTQAQNSHSILDKFASFDMADSDEVIRRLYPSRVDTPAVAHDKTAYDNDYQLGPYWIPDRQRNDVLRRDLPAMIKKADDTGAGGEEQAQRYGERGAHQIHKAYGIQERRKSAFAEARRQAAAAEDRMRVKIAEVTDYFRLPAGDRLPVAVVESVAIIKHGSAATHLLDTVLRLCPKASREKRAGDRAPLIRRLIDERDRPFCFIDQAIKTAEEFLQLRRVADQIKEELTKHAQEYLDPFVHGRTRSRPGQDQLTSSEKTGSYSPLGWGVEVGAIAAGDILAHKATHDDSEEMTSPDEEDYDKEMAGIRAESTLTQMMADRNNPLSRYPRRKVINAFNQISRKQPSFDGDLQSAIQQHLDGLSGASPIAGKQSTKTATEKKAIFGTPAMGAAVGTAAARLIGDVPKGKGDLIEDDWLDLEDPKHQNELRKIRAHAMLNSMLTDPDDPISSHDPDSVISAYNEISSLAPRVSEQPAAVRPLLQRRLQGNVQPFEAKEITDIEKGIVGTRQRTPSGGTLSDAPDSILG